MGKIHFGEYLCIGKRRGKTLRKPGQTMENLSQHIEYLLIRRECVILPGIGAFIATRHGARIDIEGGKIQPPSREISFNPEVTTDDGMLAHSVARSNGCDFEQGRQILEKMLERLTEALGEHGKVRLGNIGFLGKRESRLSFTPQISASRMESLSGMKIISLRKPDKIEVAEDRDYPAADPRYYVVKIPKSLVRGAAAIFAMALVCLSVLLPSAERQPETLVASVVPVENVISKLQTPQPAAEADLHPLHADIQEPTTESEEESEAIPEESISEPGRYCLIVGTFATRKGAESYRDIRRQAGDNLELYPSRSGIWRVSYADGTKTDLLSIMKRPDFHERYPEAWIWERQ